jgi:hypothetical protein
MRREEAVSVSFFCRCGGWLLYLFRFYWVDSGIGIFFRGRETCFLSFLWVWCVVGYAA